ncbi:MAG: glycine zipper 2TM domain-containing protein [Halopseudomonas sp.]
MNTTTITRLVITGLTIAGLGMGQAWADSSHRNDRGHGGKGNNGRQHFAKVIAVDPITQSISRKIPIEQCWSEQVRYEGSNGGYRSNTGTLLGGIIGAAIGNNLGRGHHRDNKNIKTVAGGLLGAAIGRDISARSQSRHSQPEYRTEQRCSTEYETQWEQRITGYNVTYRYQGETYNTRMDYDPGKKIRVHVQVRPVI